VSPPVLDFGAVTVGTTSVTRTFEVTNAGGTALSWSASTDNVWLAVSPQSGTVNPGASVPVTVTAATGSLTAGTYHAALSVTAAGVSGSPQTIAVTLTVEASHYTEPPILSSSVPVAGSVKKTGGALLPGDELAAYSVHPKPGAPGKYEKTLVGRAVVAQEGVLPSMAVNGDDPLTDNVVEGCRRGEEIQFVLWSASEQKEYTAYVDAATGLPPMIVWTDNVTQIGVDLDFIEGVRIPLRTGAWNLMGHGVLKGYEVAGTQFGAPQLPGTVWEYVASLGDAFPMRSIAGKYERIIGNDGGGARIWNPALAQFSTLRAFVPGYGYWIRMKSAAQDLAWMTVPGTPAGGLESLQLNPGWTLLGYSGSDRLYNADGYDPSGLLVPLTVKDNVVLPSLGDYWSSIAGLYGRVMAFDASGALQWNPAMPTFSTLKYVAPGYGYWMQMRSAGTLEPGVPLGLSATSGFGSVTLSWTPLPGATSYNLYWSTSPGVGKGAGSRIPGVTSPYNHTGLTNGTTYYYILTAVIGGVESAESPAVSATPQARAPSITGFYPASGSVGTTVTITGNYFDNTAPGNTVVRFNGVQATISSITNSQIITSVPAGATTGSITVTTEGGTATSSIAFIASVAGTVAAPTFIPAPGIYTTAQSVTISTSTPGADIRYTTDGTTPSESMGIAYSGSIPVSSSITIRAVAYMAGWSNSMMSNGSYTISASTPRVTASGTHTIALKRNGTVWGWGLTSGDGVWSGYRYVPSQVSGLTNIIFITAGYRHSVALKGDGSVWAWDYNDHGQLGDGTTTARAAPVQVMGLTGIRVIAAGYAHTVAVRNDGTVWAWGLNDNGQLGDGTIVKKYTPVQVSGLTDIVAIAAGMYHTVAVKSDGTVWTWGLNNRGQLGDGSTIDRNTPVQVVTLSGIASVAAGWSHSVALKSNGTVWTWGAAGMLGDGTYVDRPSPGRVSALAGVTAIAASTLHTVALISDRTVWGWGSNSSYELSYLGGNTSDQYSPVQISGLTNIVSVGTGSAHTVALGGDDRIWALGDNSCGQLGDGTGTIRSMPIQTLQTMGGAPFLLSRGEKMNGPRFDFVVYGALASAH